MTPAEIAVQREIDEEILHYVRELATLAPIRVESVWNYLRRVRRRELDEARVRDRLDYLVDRGLLRPRSEWMAGEGNLTVYEISAQGRDVLDGALPWPGR